ncbi:MAG: nuclear transport factor 2 family protein [Flammeovirgaceae bacterium]
MEPKALIEKWVEAFNEGDAIKIAEFYHEDAINHQVAHEPITGKTAIKEMFAAEFSQAEMTCIPENIFTDGEWAILEWKDPLGLRGCGFFHVTNGKIKFQRGYWDKLSFLRMHNLPIPSE